jgi:sterol desaturase/sphingolipid hydroxylase (fatty acid hydroxylase superfamily)
MLTEPGVAASLCWIAFGKPVMAVMFEWAMRLEHMRGHRVFRVAIPVGQAIREIRSSWHVLLDALILAIMIATKLIRLSPPSVTSLITTFVLFYCWVETSYYFGHRLMHRTKWLYRFHKMHHLTKVVTPVSSMSMSTSEKVLLYTGPWLLFMGAVSWVLPISLYGMAFYYAFHFLISLHGHSNTDASPVGVLLTKLGMGSATSHAVHHARPNVNFGFSCLFWDHLLKSYDPETAELQRRALRGDGTYTLRKESALVAKGEAI